MNPEMPILSLKMELFISTQMINAAFYLNSIKILQNPPEMARDVTQRTPYVHPTYTVGIVTEPPGRSRRRPRPNVLFFSGEEKVLALFFRPIGATVDLEKC